jgi:hypothetical protein
MTGRVMLFFVVAEGKRSRQKIITTTMPASIINHYSQLIYLEYQLIFLEKYISIPMMTNNPTLPISSEKSC